jgi:methionyl-tRNA formyltransferase
LKSEDFLNELKGYKADLQIVVAFRMLPEVVWSMPSMGTINLHASLLPQYRGAAPINWAIINGENETGVTTFFLQHQIDTGDIIMQKSVPIGTGTTAGELHNQLAMIGSDLIIDTYNSICKGDTPAIAQHTLITGTLKQAPKIFKEDCRIDWKENCIKIYNLIRGLSPRPGAWTILQTDQAVTFSFKVFECKFTETQHTKEPGEIQTEDEGLQIFCANGYISVIELQIEGKRKMHVDDFLRGAHINNKWKAT